MWEAGGDIRATEILNIELLSYNNVSNGNDGQQEL